MGKIVVLMSDILVAGGVDEFPTSWFDTECGMKKVL